MFLLVLSHCGAAEEVEIGMSKVPPVQKNKTKQLWDKLSTNYLNFTSDKIQTADSELYVVTPE